MSAAAVVVDLLLAFLFLAQVSMLLHSVLCNLSQLYGMVSGLKQLAMQAVWRLCNTLPGLLRLCLGAGDENKSRSFAMTSFVLISEALSFVVDR